MSSVKLVDVARAAGVSVSAASHALNGKGRISAQVRQRIMKIADQLGYKSNIHAASIAGERVTHVGVVVIEDYEKAFEWYFIRRILITIEETITRQNLYPIIIPVSLHDSPEKTVTKILASGSGGLFSIHFGSLEVFRILKARGIPVVVVNNAGYQNEFPTICNDDFQGAFEGTNYLLNLGHERIAFIDYGKTDIPTVLNDRFMGYRKAMESRRLWVAESTMARVKLNDHQDIERKVSKILSAHPAPTAMFVHDDYLSSQIINALNRKGIRVPEDISLIAPGDTLDYSLPFIPQITTMRIDTDLMGKLAGQMMIGLLNKEESKSGTLKVGQYLTERKSCQKRVPDPE